MWSRTSILSLILFAALGCSGPDENAIPVFTSNEEFNAALREAVDLSKLPLERFDQGVAMEAQDKSDLIKSAKIYNGLIAYSPTSFALYLGAAKVDLALGDPQRAKQRLEQSLRIIPQSGGADVQRSVAEIHYQLGSIALNEKDFKLALARAQAALDTAPKDPNYWVLKGSAEVQLRQLSDARKSLEKALEIDPSNHRGLLLKRLIELSEKNK